MKYSSIVFKYHLGDSIWMSYKQRAFFILTLVMFTFISIPLVFPMAMGGVLAVLFFPWLERLERLRIPTWLGSTALTLSITVLLIFPTTLLLFLGAKTGFGQLQAWKNSGRLTGATWVETMMRIPKVNDLVQWITEKFPITPAEVTHAFEDLTNSISLRLADFLGGILSHLPGLAVSLLVIVVSVYFFLSDGKSILYFLRRNKIFSSQQTEYLICRMGEMCRSVILAAVVSGILQGFVEGIICLSLGVPNAPWIAFLVFMASFIPLIGALPITLWVAMQQSLEGNTVSATILFIAVFIIIAADNTIRPMFLKGRANLHPLLAFIGALGGLQTIGVLGVFLGPTLAALFTATFQVVSEVESAKNDFLKRNFNGY